MSIAPDDRILDPIEGTFFEDFLQAISRITAGESPLIPDLTPDLAGVKPFESPFGEEHFEPIKFEVPRVLERDFQRARAKDVAQGVAQGVDPWAVAADPTTFKESRQRWMKRWENGRIPYKHLIKVGPSQFLHPMAAKAFKAAQRAAKRAGVNLQITPGAGNAYRDYATQVRLDQTKDHLAAEPGTSVHGWGMAIDLSPEGREWLQKNGDRFGWHWPEWARPSGSMPEPWHFEFVGWDGALGATTRPKRQKEPRPRRPQEPQIGDIDLVSPSNPMVVMPLAFGNVLGEINDERRQRRKSKKVAQEIDEKGGGRIPDYVPNWAHKHIREAAEKYGLPVRLVAAVGWHESRWNRDVNLTSSAGAIGPMQTMPFWQGDQPHNIHTLRGNIFAGVWILNRYINQAGSLRKGLAMYNAGPGRWQRGLGYADMVLRTFRGHK